MKIRLVVVASGSGESTELLGGHIRELWPSAQIMRVTDCSTATAVISEHSPDLILIDTVSAGMDGFAVCAKLKHDDRINSIPQICFYSPDERENKTRALHCGADALLPWPPDHEELMAMAASLTKRIEKHKKQLANLEKTIRLMVNDITGRKLLEQKVREKDLQFRKLSANVHDLIFQFTRKADGTYTVPIASEGIKNIFGCSPEDVLNDFSPIARVIHPEDIEKVINAIEHSAKNLSYFTCEFRVQRPGHPLQWIFSRSTPEKLTDGSITWYGFNADITYRRQVEEALRESESKFRKIYEEGPYGMALINSMDKFMMANRTICQMLGYDESELLNMPVADIIHPYDRAAVAENLGKLVMRETDVVRSEKRYLRKDGSIIWASVTVTSNYDEAGTFVYNLAIAEDITERRLASERVGVLNERLSLMVEAIQELSTTATMKGIMKIVMDSARRLLNADGATFVLREGDHCFYADEDAVSPLWKGQRCQLEKCINGWVMQNRQAVIIEDVYADDMMHNEIYQSTFVRSLAIAPIRLNNPLGAIGVYWSTIVTPSTAELQLLQTLADAAAKAVENIQLIEGLERTISDRTADLQAVNRELEAFSYSVSHDLRAPLRHINGFSEILMRKYSEQIPPEAVKYLETIVGSATRMGTLIDDLLSLSRTSRAELKIVSVNMDEIVRGAIMEVNQNPGDRKIEWQIAKLPVSSCDANLMRLVWINLIDNALKYTSTKDNAVIQIGYKAEARETVFFIRDNGVGFDMKYAQKLFGVFQRMHSSAEFEGTGIGLANVQRIILRHGGRVWAQAEIGKGAVFSFSLPFDQDKLALEAK
jgi:PAS domain S-box-containing protein